MSRRRTPLVSLATATLVIAAATCAATCGVARAQSVVDPSLRVQTWARGLNQPTGIAFIDNAGTALVTEKSTGRVRILSGKAVTGTALDLPVNGESERGLLGIALSPTFASDRLVYLNYTRANADGGDAIDNRVERYTWNGSSLSFDRRVLTMPATPGPNHNGGKIAFGPDGKLYAAVGDLNRNESTLNFERAKTITRTGAILRVNPSGSSVTTNPFYDAKFVGTRHEAINDLYAYGVRNSFGIAFDPVSGSLWDTENGPERMDEINRVTPGFNSGWQDVMGPTSRNGGSTGKLVSMGPKAHYEEPKLSWDAPVAPTDAYFMETARLGREYKNDLFVGTVRGGGVIYRFGMSPSRKTLGLSGDLADGVADNRGGGLLAEQDDIVWGTGFGTVTDILAGPGGMYVLSIGNGALYRITTTTSASALPAADVTAVPEPPPLALIALAGAFLCKRATRPRVA
ncbi:MAG TPA: PQQ-dependent sugar dehydrogenase [Tepidisphaeraceae bacterium]|nr:PQQ-dependent sugar dehydrogenase [Tepidisphaeraceae bacterium]